MPPLDFSSHGTPVNTGDTDAPDFSSAGEPVHDFSAAGERVGGGSAAAFVHGAERGVAPALTGMAGMGAGAEAGAAVGAVGGPAGIAVGGILGALAGGFGGAYLGSEAQERLLALLPDSVRAKLGQTAAQREAEGVAHPIASAAGELLPQVITMRPGAIAQALPDATAFERLIANPLVARGAGATLAASTEAAQEKVAGEPLSPGRIGVAAGYGALLNRPTAVGTALERAGARLVPEGIRAVAEAHPVPPGGTQTAPEPAPEPVVRNHQTGYDLETNTFKVVGPEGETVKAGFAAPEQAEAEARRLDGIGGGNAPGAPEPASGVEPREPASPLDIAAAEAEPEPTEAQKEAGNYRKGHVNVQGLDIAIETPRGGMRRGVGPTGEPWENVSPAHYGYIKRTEGADGEHVDTYVGPHPESERAFVVDQVDPATGEFDEHKAILGARNINEARDIYDRGFSDDSGPSRRAAIAEMPIDEFKRWLREGDTKAEVAPQVSPRDWAEIALPMAEREAGVTLTDEQRATAAAMIRNGMDSTQAVKEVAFAPPFQAAETPGRGEGTFRISSWFDADLKPSEQYTAKEAEAVRRVQAITNRMSPGAQTDIYARLYGGPPGEPKDEIWGASYRSSINRVIAVSLASPDVQQSAMHEVIHDLRGVGAFTDKEWATLEKAATDDGWIDKHDIVARYGDGTGLPPGRLAEEAIAEEFSKSRANKFKGLPEPIRQIFLKLDEYLRRIGNAARQIFGREATPEDIFTRAETGEVGARPTRYTRGEPAFQRPDPDRDRMAPQGFDPHDPTSQAIAAAGGEERGTYGRTLDKMALKPGVDLVKNLNMAERGWIFPHTLAKTDTLSARLWSGYKAMDATHSRLNEGFRSTIRDNFLKLDKAGRENVYAALELMRLKGMRVDQVPDRPFSIKNDGQIAAKSKPGQTISIGTDHLPAIKEAVALGQKQMQALMEGSLRKIGWSGAIDAGAISAAAREAKGAEARQLGRMAELAHMMKQQAENVYFPMMRFGDHYLSIRAKSGTEADSLGGFPSVVHFSTYERPALQDFAGLTDDSKWIKGFSADEKRNAAIAELEKQYPHDKYDYETGLISRNPEMLRRLNIPQIEKLMMALENAHRGEIKQRLLNSAEPPETEAEAKLRAKAAHEDFKSLLLDSFRDGLYNELRAGFKRKANFTPGYDADFDRAIGTHMGQISRNAAEMTHREEIERSYEEIQRNHPHKSVKEYWADWRKYQESPTSPMGRVAQNMSQLGFVYTLGMNPSSTLIFGLHTPMAVLPAMSTGIGMGKAFGTMKSTLAYAYRHAGFDTERGAHIDLDRAISRLPPDEAAAAQRMMEAGAFHTMGRDDLAALNDKQADLWGRMKPLMRRALDIYSSNIGIVDQANRFGNWLAWYRLAKNPETLQRMANAWRDNQVFRDMAEREGLTPETMAKFGLSESSFEWGKMNRPTVMRGALGTMMFTLHGFQTRFLSQAFKMATRMGPEGKIAFGWMMAGLFAGAGAAGLPFSQDIENAVNWTWKILSGGKDMMLDHRIRALLADAGLGKIGAEIAMQGPVGTLLGADVSSRIGFGDVVSRELEGIQNGGQILGTVPSIVAGRVMAAERRLHSRQGIAAAGAELLPSGPRNVARAAIEAQQGMRSQKGRMYIPPSKVTPHDIAARTLGFRPLSEERAYQRSDYSYRAKRSKMGAPKMAIPQPTE